MEYCFFFCKLKCIDKYSLLVLSRLILDQHTCLCMVSIKYNACSRFLKRLDVYPGHILCIVNYNIKVFLFYFENLFWCTAFVLKLIDMCNLELLMSLSCFCCFKIAWSQCAGIYTWCACNYTSPVNNYLKQHRASCIAYVKLSKNGNSLAFSLYTQQEVDRFRLPLQCL